MMIKARNRHHGPSLDDFLKEEGALEQFQAAAVKEVIAWQIQEAMKTKKPDGTADAHKPRPSRPPTRSDPR
jgi:hypothetical protein